MPNTYRIINDDSGRWISSGSDVDMGGEGPAYRSFMEAYDVARARLESRGMIVGNLRSTGTGLEFDAIPGPLLYSSDASQTIEELKGRFARRLRRAAVTVAEKQGRRLVSEGDVWAALDELVGTLLDEESTDD